MKNYLPKKYNIKVRLFNEEPSFGKGIVELLEGVEKYGSLSASYKHMNMAASKAWKILNRAEEDLHVTLVHRHPGGKNGGVATLTDEAKDLIVRYYKMMEEISKATQVAFERYFKDEDDI